MKQIPLFIILLLSLISASHAEPNVLQSLVSKIVALMIHKIPIVSKQEWPKVKICGAPK